MRRREFTQNQREQIVLRAKKGTDTIWCEKCGAALKPGAFEIDHIIAEGLRPEADKKARLTIAEGQLLGKCCHRGADGKTNADVTAIAEAKRRSAKHNGYERKTARPLQSAGFPKFEKPRAIDKSALPALGKSEIYRRTQA